MTTVDASQLRYWESVADFGAILVIIGVAGEGLEIALKIVVHKVKAGRFVDWYERHKFAVEMFGAIFWIMVVAGLIVERRGSHESQRIMSLENSRLNEETATARREAGVATERAAKANERAEILESTNKLFALQLSIAESNNLALKIQLERLTATQRDRHLTEDQKRDLETELRKLPARVEIKITTLEGEPTGYAQDLRTVFEKCGFKVAFEPKPASEWPEKVALWPKGITFSDKTIEFTDVSPLIVAFSKARVPVGLGKVPFAFPFSEFKGAHILVGPKPDL